MLIRYVFFPDSTGGQMKYLRCILIYILVFFHSLSLYPLAPPSPDMAGMVEQARAKLAGPTNRLAADFYQTPKVVSPLPFPNNILNERNE